MHDVPEIRYAKVGDIHVAYQEFGAGPVAIVLVPGTFAHIEASWELPAFGRFWRRLAGFARVVIFDKRGTGLSDRVGAGSWPSLEERALDVGAVMDAIGLEQAAIMGVADGGPVGLMFAATHPERTQSLLLYGTTARSLAAPDYPIGTPAAALDSSLEQIDAKWGNDAAPYGLEWAAPTRVDDPQWRRHLARLQRHAASPAGAKSLFRVTFETDVRTLLPVIRVPTLVLHVRGDRITPLEQGRYLATHITGARIVELEGNDHVFVHENGDAVVGAIQEFLTGSHTGPDLDRVLVSLLFADIVDSTKRLAEIGDRSWRELQSAFREHVREELGRYRGHEVDFAGDGFLATFDGPARAVRCAAAIRERMRPLGLDVRLGVHVGEVELTAHGIAGISVHLAARIMALGTPGEILVSRTVKDLVAGSAIVFEDRGEHALKGIPAPWHLFSARC